MALGDKTIKQIERKVQADLKDELKDQGHHLTGALEQSVQPHTIKGGDSTTLYVLAEGYINPLNDGVPSDRIPYDSSASTGAKTSKYIEGLKNYAKLRFGITDDKEALGAAFAIAKTHEKEGMPTKGSYAFSSNGQRTQSIENTMTENEKEYDQIIDDGINREIDDVIGFKDDLIKI